MHRVKHRKTKRIEDIEAYHIITANELRIRHSTVSIRANESNFIEVSVPKNIKSNNHNV